MPDAQPDTPAHLGADRSQSLRKRHTLSGGDASSASGWRYGAGCRGSSFQVRLDQFAAETRAHIDAATADTREQPRKACGPALFTDSGALLTLMGATLPLAIRVTLKSLSRDCFDVDESRP